jgi:CHAT domain-containing protein
MAVTIQAQADDGFAATAVAVLGLPEDHPDRARRAAELIADVVGRPQTPLSTLTHMEGLLAAASRRPPATPQWPRIEFVARLQSLMYVVAEGPSTEYASVDARLRAAAAEAAGEPAMSALVQSVQIALDVRRAAERGDESYLQRLPLQADKWMESLPDHPAVVGLRDLLALATEGMAAHRRGHSTTGRAAFLRLAEAVEALPADAPFRESLRNAVAPGAALWSMVGADGSLPWGGLSDERLASHAEVLSRPEVDHGLVGPMLDVILMANTLDVDRIDDRIAHLRTQLSRLPMGDARRALHLQGIAMGLFRRSEVTGTIGGLDEARSILIEARDLLDGPQHPQWTLVNGILAGVEQRLGGGGNGVSSAAQAGQRGHFWRAILEIHADGARIAIREAAASAVEGARQCLSGGKLPEALRLLDTGRGLMLFAAVEQHRIPARLRDAGRDDLAAQWEKPDGTPSEAGRRQALDVLAGQTAGDLFDPPRMASIQEALALLDADALVYLVPGDTPHNGLAVMAPAEGPPAFMALPNLSLIEGTTSARYLATLSTRDAREITPSQESEFTARLADLCDWAWGAAMGPVLAGYLPRLTVPDGRVPRIVLIPMGDLARVPWHAARRPDGVYAVELASISQAVSARLMCDNAVRAPVPVGSTGLVVGDPETADRAGSLKSARVEAYAIRESFYRGARYLGRLPGAARTVADGEERTSPSGGGTAEQVFAWLVSRNPAAGTMLHLACHGFFRPEPEPAGYLLLADGSELKFDELVDVLAAAPDREIALVVLAACNSGRAVYGYDEAYSLGTGFLAGGARSVLSTQWSVPDAATSSLMYLFHHNVRAAGMPPWQALRHAQMWMLDPARTPPPGMPAELVPGPGDHPEEPLNWAGFVHYGQ